MVTIKVGSDTGDGFVDLEDDWLPIQIPAITSRKYNSGDCESPDEEVDRDMPARVDWMPIADKETEEENDGIVEESEKDLQSNISHLRCVATSRWKLSRKLPMLERMLMHQMRKD